MGKKNTGGMNIGTSSVLVAFVLLCLVTFAGLSFLSANSDYRLSRQTADKTTEYYKAGLEADRRLAELDGILSSYAAAASESSYYRELGEQFGDSHDYTWKNDEANGIRTLSFLVNINERQDLSVVLNVLYPSSGDGRCFDIQSYSVIVNSSWQDELKDEIEHYESEYQRDQNESHQLQSNPKAMERIARERYFMKYADEDIFVLNDEENISEQTSDEKVE